jgi:hypothetical protein
MVVTQGEILLRTLLGTTIRVERETGALKSIDVGEGELEGEWQDRSKQDNHKLNGKLMQKSIMSGNASEKSLSILRKATLLHPKVSYPTS